MQRFTPVPSIIATLLSLVVAAAPAAEFDARIPMATGTAATYYVPGRLGNLDTAEFMVDTGSGYLTINRTTLDALLEQNLATYLRELAGVMANGTEVKVPVYRVAQFSMGPCLLQDVEAVVFPSTDRQIVGLNVLNRSSPFIFSVNPPELILSHCTGDKQADAGISTLTGLISNRGSKARQRQGYSNISAN
jgi:predicted aspartyl protease